MWNSSQSIMEGCQRGLLSLSRKQVYVTVPKVRILHLPPEMKVYETRKRSLLKAISFRIIEIAIDSLILSFFVTIPVAVGLAIAIEATCFLLHFVFERVWNKIDYGRHILK